MITTCHHPAFPSKINTEHVCTDDSEKCRKQSGINKKSAIIALKMRYISLNLNTFAQIYIEPIGIIYYDTENEIHDR